MNIAIIPARSGSRRVKNKNIRDCNGKPLVYWSMKTANEAKCVDKTYISTESSEYITILNGIISLYKFKNTYVIPRKSAFANSRAQLEDFIVPFLSENKCSNIIILQPTSPIRLPDTLDSAYKLFKESKADSLLTVGEVDRFIWKDGKPNYNPTKRPRSQEYNPGIYYEIGSIYITKYKTFLDNMNRLGGKIAHYILKPEECFEIDTELDFVICEAALKHIYSR